LLVQANPTNGEVAKEQRMEYGLDWVRDQYHNHHLSQFVFCLNNFPQDVTVKEIGELNYKQKMEQTLPNHDSLKHKYIISQIKL